MKVTRIIDPDAVRPLHVVMVCLIAATLAGNCLLTSGPFATLEGARDWQEESPLKAVVHVLNLNYAQTTARGVAIKWLVFGVGAGLAAMVCGIAAAVPPRPGDEASEQDTVIRAPGDAPPAVALTKRQIPPLGAAKTLMAAYVLWSFCSALWSSAPGLALGGSTLLAMGVVWSLALARGLNRPAAVTGGFVLIAVLGLTAVLALAYYDERNPMLRASYPVGNPLFLAACLIPGVLLSVGVSCAAVVNAIGKRRRAYLLILVACAAAAAVMLWTLKLTGARGAALALAGGLALIVLLSVSRRAKLPVALACMAVAVAGLIYLWPRFTAESPTGRDDTLRLRAYSWSYALDLIQDSRWIGHGQGGFVQLGDSRAVEDVLDDPMPLMARIAHAHNEWLETWADLGSIGAMLVLGALVFTLWAAIRAFRRLRPAVWRWSLIALTASLAALLVEECAAPGLRVAGLPAVFYTVLGLIWALSREPDSPPAEVRPQGAGRRLSGAVGIAVGGALLVVSIIDFHAARAYYRVVSELERGDFEQAVALAEQARARRLNPYRRLAALERLCSTHLYIARDYQTSSFERYGRAHATDPPDGHLLNLANEHRSRSEGHIQRGLELVDILVGQSPDYWNSGWLAFRLYQLRLAYAQVDGNTQLFRDTIQPATEALGRELARRPYESRLAIHYAEAAAQTTPLNEIIDIIARPLRFGPIPPEYSVFLARLSNTEVFDEALGPAWEGIVPPFGEAALEERLIPEKLRLAALIRFIRQDYVNALETARTAIPYYESLTRDSGIGLATTLTELADYQLFGDPSNMQDAIANAERAMTVLPKSTPGRQLAVAIQYRLVTYHLADNDEEAARAILKELDPTRTESHLERELGIQYSLLCRSLARRGGVERPVRYADWVNRALELDETNELAWRLQAEIEFDKGLWSESAQSLARALNYGADANGVYEFVRLAVEQRPDIPEFIALEAELRALLFPTGAPPDTTVPTAPCAPPIPDTGR